MTIKHQMHVKSVHYNGINVALLIVEDTEMQNESYVETHYIAFMDVCNRYNSCREAEAEATKFLMGPRWAIKDRLIDRFRLILSAALEWA